MAKTNPARFIRQVRSEVSKVVWPTRRETVVSTIIVFAFVTLMAVLFLLIDQVIAVSIRTILGLGG